MKILLTPYNWHHQPIAGGEIYLTRLCNYLLSQGHEIKAIVGSESDYVHDGIECFKQGSPDQIFKTNNDLFQWCDIVISQLLGTAYGFNKAHQHQKPLVFIAHNNSQSYPTRFCEPGKLHVIYNSHNLQKELSHLYGHQNGFVLHPLMPELPRVKKTKAKNITLINLNENKGSHIFIELAKRLPQFQFLGVKGGYDRQIIEKLDNVTYFENGCDIRAVLQSTKVLLVLSQHESYSQVAMEAMISGIPVIATPISGIQENLGDAGIYCERTDLDGLVWNIVNLIENKTAWQKQSDLMIERANECRQQSNQELQYFNNWLSKIK